MKRRVFAWAGAFVVAACGGSSSPAGGQVSGTLFGASFTSVDAAAVAPPATTCPLTGPAPVALLAIGIGDQAGLCSRVQQPCIEKPNRRTVTILVVRAGQQQPIGVGSYAITIGTPTPDLNGNVTFVAAQAEKVDASCQTASGPPDATGGTVNVTSVAATEVKGTVDLAFSDGGHVSGPFTAPLCSVALDVCSEQLPACSAAPTCQP